MVYGTGAPGLLTLPIGIDPSGQNNTIGWLITGTLVSFVLATVLIFAVVIWGLDFVLTEARDLMISAFSK